jgi:D-alanyl-D-alanine carboxypeptidase/D-alanyl-D-alanine-endopeptidase (penicillin-binding protein 4)
MPIQNLCHARGAGHVAGHGRQARRAACVLGRWRRALAHRAKPVFELNSAPLAEIIRDINKYSNNVMAQQVVLEPWARRVRPGPVRRPQQCCAGPGSFAASRAVVQRWWKDRLPDGCAPVLDNGSGLSRSERISAQALGRLLQTALPHR